MFLTLHSIMKCPSSFFPRWLHPEAPGVSQPCTVSLSWNRKDSVNIPVDFTFLVSHSPFYCMRYLKKSGLFCFLRNNSGDLKRKMEEILFDYCPTGDCYLFIPGVGGGSYNQQYSLVYLMLFCRLYLKPSKLWLHSI